MSETGKKLSAKDYFKGNKIGFIVLGGVMLLVLIFVMLSRNKNSGVGPSSVVPPPQVNGIGGQAATPRYNQELAEVNAAGAKQALATGHSFVPTPTGVASEAFSGAPLHPTLGLNLDAKKPAPTPSAAQVQMPAPTQPVAAQQPQPLVMANPPSAYMEEVKSVLGAQAPMAPTMIAVAKVESPQAQANTAGTPSTGPAVGSSASRSVLSGLDLAHFDRVQFTVVQIAADSDMPGPVMLRIPQGPLSGATLVGTFRREGDYLTLQMDSMWWKGLQWSTKAVAVDPGTSLPAVRSAVDHHTIERYASLLGGAFLGALQGYGQAIAQSGQTTVQSSGLNSTITTTPTISAHQALIIAGATAAGTAAQTVGQSVSQGWNTKPTVRLSAGQGVGVLFIDLPRPDGGGQQQAASPALPQSQPAPSQTQPQASGLNIPVIRVGAGEPLTRGPTAAPTAAQ